jgi:DNA ligase-1
MNFKPLLASKLDINKIIYPVLGSPKLDGIRAMIFDKIVYSRKLIKIPNKLIQNSFGIEILNNYDGELILGSPVSNNVYRKTNSAVMTENSNLIVDYHIFDYINNESYIDRYKKVAQLKNLYLKNIKIVDNVLLNNEKELLNYEQELLDQGYEGLMVRKIDGVYKQGRSTVNEGILLKLKRFVDNEAIVIGFTELMSNQNKVEIDNLGYLKRSSNKENLVAMGMLGALILKGINGKFKNVIFNLGVGFTNEDRIYIWNNRDSIMNIIVKYKHFDIGNYDKPRMLTFVGFRSLIDF